MESFDLWALPMRDGKATGLPSLVKRDTGRGAVLGITNSGAYHYFPNTIGIQQVFVAQLDTTGKLPASVRLTESFIGRQPSWSPDGKSLEFAKPRPDGSFNVVRHAMETGEEQRFARRGLQPYGVLWLHDGTEFLAQVAVSSDLTPPNSIYAIDAKSGAFREVMGPNKDRSDLTVLSPDDKTSYQFARNPGGTLAFNRVVAVDLATDQERVILSLTGPIEALPRHVKLALTPDGRTLAIAICDQKSGDCRLTRVGVDGAGHRDVFGPFKATFLAGLAWTKDGRAILFAAQEGTKWRLMRVNADGGQPEFTGLQMDGLGTFAASPDGSRVAFSSTGPSSTHDLWALDVLSLLKKPR
jgi:Tol biopolymer transport system component